MAIYRIYTKKKKEFAVESDALKYEIENVLQINGINEISILNRYDVEGISKEQFEQCLPVIFYEPQIDDYFFDLSEDSNYIFAVEPLPGQFDARASSCEECIQYITKSTRPTVRTAKIYTFSGNLTKEEIASIKLYIINPVECRETDLSLKTTLRQTSDIPEDISAVENFINFSENELTSFISANGLAMDIDDIIFCKDYFKSINRNPTLTEIKMIDTYWSDHCRHTTFLTVLEDIKSNNPKVTKAYERYLDTRKALNITDKPVTLMDLATIATKALKSKGLLSNLDESDEINACSIVIDVDNNGTIEPWLLQFKNETHNHPTEIEPFGGAATCIGGAIRDPLSGRAYVYQAMRVTGASNPLDDLHLTLPGKLPQRKIVTTAANGYSSYGNQIGLATGQVTEIYHPGYAAKRMEIGAVIGAVPLENVRREEPISGDVVVLIGGRTGRDGCGGATGSSKSHDLSSLETCGAEVQKGNPVVERKLQRLFRQKEVTKLIKRCNDFGAGGVSVAIGELADGLQIDLDKITKKYDGLNGTELAISESQERMAVVVAKNDAQLFISYANAENLEATVVAEVTSNAKLCMTWRNKTIVDLDRSFLNSNGAKKVTSVIAENNYISKKASSRNIEDGFIELVNQLNTCSQKGLSERFDSTIGASTITMPFGGIYQQTPIQTMVSKLPVVNGETTTCSAMAFGFDPLLMEQSPYEGAYLSVAHSLCKLVSAGFSYKSAYLTFQEYFKRMKTPSDWGQPFSALLGAFDAQMNFGTAAIGGKDSMSGTFENISVPPTLVSFSVGYGNINNVVTPEFKKVGSKILYVYADVFSKDDICTLLDDIQKQTENGTILSAWSVGNYGIADGLFKMAIGNRIGINLSNNVPDLFVQNIGGFIIEVSPENLLITSKAEVIKLGTTTKEYSITYDNKNISLSKLESIYDNKLEKVFPQKIHKKPTSCHESSLEKIGFNCVSPYVSTTKTKKPLAIVPSFPGTNCETDTARALELAGAKAQIVQINNLTQDSIKHSIDNLCTAINSANIIVFPGGFSAGDEPDGSAKSIASIFRNPDISNCINHFLSNTDGLILGICNGFQALIKLGLLPFGKIIKTDETCPTLTFNSIARHQSMLVTTRIASNKSPWLSCFEVGQTHTIPISHGEGRFICNNELLENLKVNGQIATQYVNLLGEPTMDINFNPNGSVLAIEGITSPDGRILGKMGHSERFGSSLYKNVPLNTFQPIFENGVKYFM